MLRLSIFNILLYATFPLCYAIPPPPPPAFIYAVLDAHWLKESNWCIGPTSRYRRHVVRDHRAATVIVIVNGPDGSGDVK